MTLRKAEEKDITRIIELLGQVLQIHADIRPDIFLLAAERIHCTPETCYVFEDSENGIRAGKAEGCTAIMIPDVLAPSEEIKKFVDGIYESLYEFTEEVLEK